MKKEFQDLLVEGLNDLDIKINAEQIEAFNIFLKELLKWNSKYNLTAINNEKDIIIKHFLDSSIISQKNQCNHGKMIDIGSGAGFPGIVLKILKPDILLTSVDSNEKKIFFQKNLIRKLRTNHVDFIASRVEDSSFIDKYKNYFDCAVVRAFKQLDEILTLCYPIIKKGGTVSVFKGRNYKRDMEALAESKVGSRFTLITVDSYKLPYINRQHHILIYQKNKPGV